MEKVKQKVNKVLTSKGEEKAIKALQKTKWFKERDVDPETATKVYNKVCKKYKTGIGYVQPAGDDSWAFMVKTDNGEWVETVYAKTMNEGLYKCLLVLYVYLIKKVNLREEG